MNQPPDAIHKTRFDKSQDPKFVLNNTFAYDIYPKTHNPTKQSQDTTKQSQDTTKQPQKQNGSNKKDTTHRYHSHAREKQKMDSTQISRRHKLYRRRVNMHEFRQRTLLKIYCSNYWLQFCCMYISYQVR